MSKKKNITTIRNRRMRRTRARIREVGDHPRLSVFRSARHIYAQLIDDTDGKTVASASSVKDESKKVKDPISGKKTDQAKEVGKSIAEKAKKLNIKKAVFDRGGYKYHGRVKALAEGARGGGLEI